MRGLTWIPIATLLVIPWVEYWLLEKLGISVTLAVLESMVTAGVGWRFSRTEELSLWTELESDVQNHRVPTIEGVDAMLVVLGGWALMIPGLLTDILGAAFVLEPIRRKLVEPIRGLVRTYLI